jgi:hypothetical protein
MCELPSATKEQARTMGFAVYVKDAGNARTLNQDKPSSRFEHLPGEPLDELLHHVGVQVIEGPVGWQCGQNDNAFQRVSAPAVVTDHRRREGDAARSV